jgi:MFS family permease
MSATAPTGQPAPRLSGLSGFTVIMFGQVFSLVGTAMSGFALTIWAFERTGSATALALVGFFFVTPMLIFSPVAGALVDRMDRKAMMVISDLSAGAGSLAMLILSLTGDLQIWHVYAANALMGLGQTFQFPAYSAAITTMMSKEHYGRANGMWSLAETGSGILAPVLAGALFGVIGLSGVLAIDLAALAFAISALLIVHIPQPKQSAEGAASRGSLLKESMFGFSYILKRPSLLGLQIVFLVGNFLATISFTLVAPMILSRTQNNELMLGTANSIGAIGGVVGGLLMSTLGGTRRKVHGVLTGWTISGFFGVLVGLGRGLPLWAAGQAGESMMGPWINGSNQAIWQAKVPADIQGKVFSIRRLIAWFSTPLATLTAGPLADYVMEPAMREGGSLTATLGPVFGVGPGSGMAATIVLCCLGMMAVGLGGYLFPVVRDAETLLPDHDEDAVVVNPAALQAISPPSSE